MARDDSHSSSHGRSSGDAEAHGDRSWDFDLPDLGASTTPGHHRRGPAPSEGAGPSGRDARSGSSDDSSWEEVRSVSGSDDRSADRSAGIEPDALRNEYTEERRGARPVYDAEKDAHHTRTSRRQADERSAHDDDDAYEHGPVHGPEVYRRRRIIALLLAVLLVGALGFGVMNLVSGSDEQPQPDPAATASTGTDPFAGFSARPESRRTDGASGPAAEACGDSLKVTASTDKEVYSGKDRPVLVMTLENTSKQPCMVNAGTARMNYSVASGQDKVFDSVHCQIDGQDRPIELEAGEKESARFEWNERRSVPDCATEGEQVQPGTYRLTVALGESRSEGVEFRLE